MTEKMAKDQISAGQTLVAKYKKQQYTCEVVEREGKLCFVLPQGDTFKSPSAAGTAITGKACNGYVFWAISNDPPSGQSARQQAARKAVGAAEGKVAETEAVTAKPKRKAAEAKPKAKKSKPKSKSLKKAAATKKNKKAAA